MATSLNKSIVRLDRVHAVYNGPIESVVYNAGELQNGWIVEIGDLVTGQRDLRSAVVPTGTARVALIAHSEINTDETLRTDSALENFYAPAGKAVRAYDLRPRDIYSVSPNALTLIGTDAVVGNYLILDKSFKLKEVTKATLTGTEIFVAKIIDKEVLGTPTLVGQAGVIARMNTYIGIEVVKNG